MERMGCGIAQPGRICCVYTCPWSHELMWVYVPFVFACVAWGFMAMYVPVFVSSDQEFPAPVNVALSCCSGAGKLEKEKTQVLCCVHIILIFSR